MPDFNPWVAQYSPFQSQLHSQQRITNKWQARQEGARRGAVLAGQLGYGLGSIAGYGISTGVKQAQKYYRSYTKTKPTKKRKPKRKCCRYIRGRKICRPEFCHKKRYYSKKYY